MIKLAGTIKGGGRKATHNKRTINNPSPAILGQGVQKYGLDARHSHGAAERPLALRVGKGVEEWGKMPAR
jgi:hypothetical protein